MTNTELILLGILLLPALLFGLWLGRYYPAIGLGILAVGVLGLVAFAVVKIRKRVKV